MNTIQDKHQVEDTIYDLVQEIIDGGDLTVGIVINANNLDEITYGDKEDTPEGAEWYDVNTLICKDDKGNTMPIPDIDAIDELVSGYVFVR